MEFSLILKRLWSHRVLVAIGIVLAAALAARTVSDTSLSPLKIERKRSEFGAAQTMMYVDTTTNSVATSQNDTASLTARAQIFARFLGSGAVRAVAARQLGVPAQAITVSGPSPDTPGSQNLQPPAQQRANALLGRGSVYSVFVDTENAAPVITLFTQAPNGPGAIRLANAMTSALSDYVQKAQRDARSTLLSGLRDTLRIAADKENRTLSTAERRQARRDLLKSHSEIKPLGDPVGGAVFDQTGTSVAFIVFIAATLLWCVGILLVSALYRTIRKR